MWRSHDVMWRLHEVLCRSHDAMWRLHDVMWRLHEVLCRSHDVVGNPTTSCSRHIDVCDLLNGLWDLHIDERERHIHKCECRIGLMRRHRSDVEVHIWTGKCHVDRMWSHTGVRADCIFSKFHLVNGAGVGILSAEGHIPGVSLFNLRLPKSLELSEVGIVRPTPPIPRFGGGFDHGGF